MSKTAFLFPGQGAQYVGMGRDFYENYPCAKNIFDTADKILGKRITDICFTENENILKQTVNTQPCIVATSLAILEVFKEETGIIPDFVAGHSLGEYCAIYCAGVMTLEQTLSAIQKRANLMNMVKNGSMSAIIGASKEQLQTGLNEGRKFGYVDIANYNSPVQIVITGDENAVKRTGDYLLETGIKKIVPLAVSGAFHSKYTEHAGIEFAEFIKNLELKNATIPVITNVDAEITLKSEDFRTKMPKQIYSSVHWTQTIQKMIENDVETFIEIGPGKVLTGLNKKISPDVKNYNVYDIETLKSVSKILK